MTDVTTSDGSRALLVPDAVVWDAREDAMTDAAVLVEDGRITSVGPRAALRRAAPLAPVQALPGRVLLPGLVDGHSHLRGLPTCSHGVADAPLELWVVRLAAMAALDPFQDALVAAVGAVTTGVTTAQVLHHTFGAPDAYLGHLDASLTALRTARLHAEVVLGLTDQAEFVPTDVEPLLTTEQRAWLVPTRGMSPQDLPDVMAAGDALLARHMATDGGDVQAHGDATSRSAWIRLGVGPVGPQWASDDLLATIAALAGPHRRVHTHAVETLAQRTWCPDSPIDRLDRHGLLTSATSLAHAVHLTDDEVAIVARAGVTVATCPTSNATVADGTGDVAAWSRAGLSVALGLDSTGHPELPDAFVELRALLDTAADRGHHLDARDALAIATLGGAASVGRSDEIGTLRTGYRADVVAVRTPASWGNGRDDLAAALIADVDRRDVTDVWSHGHHTVSDGVHEAADATAEATAALRVELARTEPERAERRAVIAGLEPMVERIRRERTAAARGWYGADLDVPISELTDRHPPGRSPGDRRSAG